MNKYNLNFRGWLLNLIILSATLNGCIGQEANNNSNKVSANHASAGEHEINKPIHGHDDKEKIKDQHHKEIYAKLGKHGVENIKQQVYIDRVLQKLPLHILSFHAEKGSNFEHVAGNWEQALTKYGVDPLEAFVDYTSRDSSQSLKIRDGLAYPVIVDGKVKLLVREDNHINYAQNGEERKRLYYAALRGFLEVDDLEIDSEFVKLLQQASYNGVNRYLGHQDNAKLIGLSEMTDGQMNIKYKQELYNSLAYVSANYAEDRQMMLNLWPDMVAYLDKFNNRYFDNLAFFNDSIPHKIEQCRSGVCGVILPATIGGLQNIVPHVYPLPNSTGSKFITDLAKDSGGKHNIYNFTVKDGERDYPTLYRYNGKEMRTLIFHGEIDGANPTKPATFEIFGERGVSISETMNKVSQVVGKSFWTSKHNLAQKDIFLNVCFGGYGGKGSLAQHLADKYEVTVIAATGKVELGSPLVADTPGLATTAGKWYIYQKNQMPIEYMAGQGLEFVPHINGKFTPEEKKDLDAFSKKTV